MYNPTAIVYNSVTKQPNSLASYEQYMSVDEAKSIINAWKKNPNIQILSAYIKDSTTEEIVYLENNINTLGQIEYKQEDYEQQTKHI